jgi:hypothetical protein
MRKFVRSLAGLTLATPLAALALEPEGGPYVTQALLAEQGGVEFSLPRFGTFTIDEIEAPPGGGECHVSLDSVADDIERSLQTGELDLAVGAAKTVKLRVWVFPNGRVKCYGPGKGCKVKVSVTTIDPESVEPM